MPKVLLSIILSGLLSSLLLAQKPNFKFKKIDQSDGLANSTVLVMFEDSFGFIWLGTQNGLQRYDGKTYHTFVHSDEDTNSLSANYITGFCEDARKDIWISTFYGLNKYNRKTDKVERYVWHDKAISKNEEFPIPSLITDQTDINTIWITATGIGLVRLNLSNDSVKIYPLDVDSYRVFGWILPYPGDDNKLLIGSTRLLVFDKISGTFTEILELEQNNTIPNNHINAAALDPTNKDLVWLATGDLWGRGTLGGLIKFNLKTYTSEIFSTETRRNEFHTNHLMSITFHDDNNLWIGTRISGALLYQIKKDRFYHYHHNEYHEGSFITSHAVRSILRDRSGTCWFGSWGDGMSLLSPAAQKFSHYMNLPGHPEGLPDNHVYTFAEDKDGNMWIGTEEGGLSKFNPKNKTFENYFQDFISTDGDVTQINCIFYDSRQNLWIGTYDDALYRFDPVSGERVHFEKGTTNKHVTQKRISAISEFTAGEIMISTYGGGLNIYSYETNSFKHYMHDPDDPSSIPDNQIWLPFLGDDGNYYLSGNSTTRLIQYNPVTEKFRKYPSLLIATFLSPLIHSNGSVFIDNAPGLRELVIGDEIKCNFVLDEHGNTIRNVESMLEDDSGNLWLGTGNGLLNYNLKTKVIKRYDSDDGLHGHVFYRVSSFRAKDGQMYFGGNNGFSVFHPDKITLSDYEPPIVFVDFKLYQETVSIGEDSPLEQNILLTDELVLNHAENDFSISFAAIDFSNPDKIEYRYMLENHDNDWIYSANNNVASYTNMDPGKYTLKVMATNGDGVWKEEAQSIRIIINPPWWLTKWAYLAYGLIFIAGVILIDRIQRRRLLEREKAQAREKELEQAKEIEKAYTSLKATQEQLLHSEKMASLGELTAGIAHEIQNPLNFVNNFSEVNRELIAELKDEIVKGDFEEAKSIASDIERNENKITHHGKRADGIVKGMLLHSRTDGGKKEPTNVNMLADEYLRLAFHGLRAKDKSFNAEFVTDLDKSIPPLNIVPQDVGRVLLNLINNAFHAVAEKQAHGIEGYKPLVIVSSKIENDFVVVSVKDNGNGIPKDVMDKIFQPFFTTKEAGEGTGLGLSISYDIITKGHKGELKVETKKNEGSVFTIYLPIQSNK